MDDDLEKEESTLADKLIHHYLDKERSERSAADISELLEAVKAASIDRASTKVVKNDGFTGGIFTPIPTSTETFASLDVTRGPAISASSSEPLYFHQYEAKMLWNMFGINYEGTQLKGFMDWFAPQVAEGVDWFVSGGVITRTLMKTDIFKGDIDIYSGNNLSKTVLIKAFEKHPNFEKTKFSHQFDYKQGSKVCKVQLIGKNVGSPSKILSHFDYEHCRIALRKDQTMAYASLSAPIALAQRELHLRMVVNPVYSLHRALKFAKMGFNADHAISQLASIISSGKTDFNAYDYEAGKEVMDY